MTQQQIEKAVYEKFPYSKAERKCATEKRTMDRLRENMRKKLIEQNKKHETEKT